MALELLGQWKDALGRAWRDVQTLLFRAGISEPERKAIETALALIEAVRQEMRARIHTNETAHNRSSGKSPEMREAHALLMRLISEDTVARILFTQGN